MIVGLGLLSTGLAYLVYYRTIEQLGSVRVSESTFIAPVVAVIIGGSVGATLLSVEIVSLATIIGGVVLIETGKCNAMERRGSVSAE